MTTFSQLDPPQIDPDLLFPDSDGKPMADNTEQFRWIVTIKENLEIIFESQPDVFIAGDLLWYPLESTLVAPMAPDVMVIFGRPKGKRSDRPIGAGADTADDPEYGAIGYGGGAGGFGDGDGDRCGEGLS
jgi:Uma2 family endonuclease